MMARQEARLEDRLLHPLTHTSRAWYAWTLLLVSLIAIGLYAYTMQLRDGLAVTGMRDTVIWGVYISNFVFFSGVSMAGTFISAILRITGAEWRRPLTRFAELTTVAALSMCALMPLVDMGRPDRLGNLFMYGRLQSPLLWDIMVITTYLTASAVYLYLFLIPDVARVRDRLQGRVSALRQRFYTVAALGWRGQPEQRRFMELSGAVMMVVIIPIGVLTHSVVSWIFGMTFRSGWDSTIFAPYFAVGALYSGTAMLITLMFIFRRVYHLEDLFTPKHFRYLGYMLVAFGVLYFYFTFAEYLTVGYKLESSDKLLLGELFFGRYAWLVWSGFIGGQVLPIVLAANPRTNKISVLFAASLLVNVGMWIKRYIIVVPALAEPLMPYKWGVYTPTGVEIAITVAAFAGFAMLITIFAKLFPIVSIWEMEEATETVRETAPARMPGGLAARPAFLDAEMGGDGHD